jgi:hypothetical protein
MSMHVPLCNGRGLPGSGTTCLIIALPLREIHILCHDAPQDRMPPMTILSVSPDFLIPHLDFQPNAKRAHLLHS